MMARNSKKIKFTVQEIDDDSVQTQLLLLTKANRKHEHIFITQMEMEQEVVPPTVASTEGIQLSSLTPPESSKGYNSSPASPWTEVCQELLDVYFEIQYSRVSSMYKAGCIWRVSHKMQRL